MYPGTGIGWPKISGIGIGWSQTSGIGIGWHQNSGIGWNFGIGTSLIYIYIYEYSYLIEICYFLSVNLIILFSVDIWYRLKIPTQIQRNSFYTDNKEFNRYLKIDSNWYQYQGFQPIFTDT